MSIKIQIPDVCERDIDLLLLEEFIASRNFCNWFLTQIGLDDSKTLVEASRSVVTPNGESDIELVFVDDHGKSRVLIENKVDAAFQPNQPERYKERAQEYFRAGEYVHVKTILMAPDSYYGSETEDYGFDQELTYESVADWFVNSDSVDTRKEYKLKMLHEAISRGKIGWKLTPHENVSVFWGKYWELAEDIAPHLAMPLPKKGIPAGSHFVTFSPAILPDSISLVHKVAYGHVDLQFSGMGDKLAEIESRYRSALESNMRIEKAAKSAVIRIRIETVDMTTSDFSDANEVIKLGIQAANQLLELYQKVSV